MSLIPDDAESTCPVANEAADKVGRSIDSKLEVFKGDMQVLFQSYALDTNKGTFSYQEVEAETISGWLDSNTPVYRKTVKINDEFILQAVQGSRKYTAVVHLISGWKKMIRWEARGTHSAGFDIAGPYFVNEVFYPIGVHMSATHITYACADISRHSDVWVTVWYLK